MNGNGIISIVIFRKEKNMLNKYRFPAIFTFLALIASMLACGSFPSAQQPSQELPAQSTPTATLFNENGTNPNVIIPCAQLIPPDDVNLLLNNATAILNENAHPGGTICTWQYTPSGGNETHLFYLEISFGTDAAATWEIKRKYELSQEPQDIVVNSIDGLGDESYVWASEATGLYVVFARKMDKTLIMRFQPADILFLQTESGIIDYAERIFNRL